mgnify:FL=1
MPKRKNDLLIAKKRKLMLQAFPELYLLEELKSVLEHEKTEEKNVECKKLILIGNLENCKISIKPQINPEIVLSKFDLESALKIDGNQHIVKSCNFTNNPTTIRLKTKQKR